MRVVQELENHWFTDAALCRKYVMSISKFSNRAEGGIQSGGPGESFCSQWVCNTSELLPSKNGIRETRFVPPVSSVTFKPRVVKCFSWGSPASREVMMREVVSARSILNWVRLEHVGAKYSAMEGDDDRRNLH